MTATATGKSWYEIRQAAKGDTVEVYIYDEIGGWGVSAAQFAKDFKAATKGAAGVDVRINSPGGFIAEGTAIYNTIKQSKVPVTVYIDGLAASIASLIAMGGKTIKMAQNALMMIHNPRALVMGESSDLRKMADLLDKMKSVELSAYSGRSALTEDEVAQAMDAETWYTAQEAVDVGLADEIVDGAAAQQAFDPEQCRQLYEEWRTAVMQSVRRDITAEPAQPGKTQEVTAMAETKDTPEAPVPLTLETLRQQYPDYVRHYQTEAVEQERQRITEIREAAFDGQDELVNKLINDGTSVVEAIKTLNRDYKQRSATDLKQLEADSASIGVRTVPMQGAQGAPLAASVIQEQLEESLYHAYRQEGKSEEKARAMARAAASL